MRMKSILALSAVSVAMLFGNAGYAADSEVVPAPADQSNQTNKSTETLDTTAATKERVVEEKHVVEPLDSAAASSKTKKVKSAKSAKSAKSGKAGHKHRRGHKHKHHRRHHHHHRHPHHHPYEPLYRYHVPHNNFFLGGMLGYGTQAEEFLTRFTVPGGDIALQVPGNNAYNLRISDSGIMMGLLGGWQWRCARTLVGLEGNVDFNTTERKDRQYASMDPTNTNSFYGTALYDRGNVYGLTGRAGYFVTPFFLPYVRLGAQVSRDTVNFQVNINSGAFNDFSSTKKDVYGFVAGVGAEIPTYIGNSTLRVEYNFVRTESVIIEDNVIPVIGVHKFRYPQSQIGKVTWVWNFL